MTSKYDHEIGGYLTGKINNGVIFLDDILIPNQRVTNTNVHIGPEDQIELRRKYGSKVFTIKGHWHSHHSMGAFFSGTDEENMRNIMVREKLFVFIVSSYRNNAFEHLVRVSVRDPITLDLNSCDIETYSYEIEDIKEFISTITPTYVSDSEDTSEDAMSDDEESEKETLQPECKKCSYIKQDCTCDWFEAKEDTEESVDTDDTEDIGESTTDEDLDRYR